MKKSARMRKAGQQYSVKKQMKLLLGRNYPGNFFIISVFFLLCILCMAKNSFGKYRVTFQPTLSVSSEYTDNLFLDNSSDLKEDEIITVISPGFIAELKSKDKGGSLTYILGHTRYEKFSENRIWRHNARMTGWMAFSKYTRMDFQDTAIITEDPAKDVRQIIDDTGRPEISEPERETIRRTRDRYLTNAAQLTFSHKFNRYDSISLKYMWDILRNEDPEIRNEMGHRPSVKLIYWPVPNRLELLSEISYMWKTAYDAVGDPGYREESIDPYFDLTYWIIPRRFSLTGGISYTKGLVNDEADLADPLNDDDNWYESIKPSIALFYDFLPYELTLESDAYYEKGISYDNHGLTDPSDDFDSWNGNIRVTKRFTRNFEVFFQYHHAIMNFKARDDTDTAHEDYKVFEPSVGFQYNFTGKIPMNLRIGYLVKDKESGKEDMVTLNGQIGNWRFTKNGSLNFLASSGYNQDNFGAEQMGFGFYYDAKLNVDYIFSKYITGNIYGLYRRNRYLDNEGIKDKDTRDDSTKEIGAGVDIKPYKWMLININYKFRDVNSTTEEDSYTDNRFAFTITFIPSWSFRF